MIIYLRFFYFYMYELHYCFELIKGNDMCIVYILNVSHYSYSMYEDNTTEIQTLFLPIIYSCHLSMHYLLCITKIHCNIVAMGLQYCITEHLLPRNISIVHLGER